MIGLFTRTLESGGFSSGNFVAVRVLGTAALLSVFFLFRDRSVFRIKPRYLLYFVGTGIVSILFFTWCYFSAMQYLSISVAVILLYTSPVFVVVLSALIFREPITRRKAAALLLTVIGCALVSGIFGGGASVTVKGFLLGLGSGFFLRAVQYLRAVRPPALQLLYRDDLHLPGGVGRGAFSAAARGTGREFRPAGHDKRGGAHDRGVHRGALSAVYRGAGKGGDRPGFHPGLRGAGDGHPPEHLRPGRAVHPHRGRGGRLRSRGGVAAQPVNFH